MESYGYKAGIAERVGSRPTAVAAAKVAGNAFIAKDKNRVAIAATVAIAIAVTIAVPVAIPTLGPKLLLRRRQRS